MSDGPWRSLPLRSHWKQVARRAESAAFSAEELDHALESALRRETKNLPHEAVCDAIVLGDQHSLFKPDPHVKIEALRRDHPGSKVVQAFLTCVLDEVAKGSSERETTLAAVAATSEECARDQLRAIIEHYLRKSPSRSGDVQHRLESALDRRDFRALAPSMLARSGSADRSPTKRTGLDDGPAL